MVNGKITYAQIGSVLYYAEDYRCLMSGNMRRSYYRTGTLSKHAGGGDAVFTVPANWTKVRKEIDSQVGEIVEAA